MMKIGDKVRFLSTTGGGIVVGFQSGNVVLVEDEDGFQIPTLANDLVVVNEDKQAKSIPGVAAQMADDTKDAIDRKNANHKIDLIDKVNENVRMHSVERDGSDCVSMYLGFVPLDKKNVSKTKFHLYVINDCNYFLSYTYSLFDGKEWRLQSHNELEPNTKLLISEIEIESVADFKNGALQINAYKVGKPYKLQPMLDVNLRVDPVKFYKLHTFCENDFFDEDAFIVPVVENGVPVKTMKIDNEELKKKMLEKQKVDITAPARKQDKKQMMDNGPLVIDLHATELLDTTAGMSHADILNYQLDVFRKTLEEFKKKKGMKIIFIHGKGDGVLRNAVVHELRYRYKSYTYQDASFQEYGYGATQVTIREKLLPQPPALQPR